MSEPLSERLRTVGLAAEYTNMPTITEAADLIDALTAERDRLRAELDSLMMRVNHGTPKDACYSTDDDPNCPLEHLWITRNGDLRAELDRLRAELAGRRMCVNCGKFAPAGHIRNHPLPECVGPDGLSACTFELTPEEAWQHWSVEAHKLRAERDRLREALEPFAAMRADDGDTFDKYPDMVLVRCECSVREIKSAREALARAKGER